MKEREEERSRVKSVLRALLSKCSLYLTIGRGVQAKSVQHKYKGKLVYLEVDADRPCYYSVLGTPALMKSITTINTDI